MPNYEKMYKELFNAFTEAIEILQKAQQLTEEMYISDSTQPEVEQNKEDE